MPFQRILPASQLRDVIECYWIVEDRDPTPRLQKIIPDGFTEVIFHFGDPYRIKMVQEWEIQTRNLLAGQIRGHFFIENTGVSHIVGIKFRPTALANWFPLAMHRLTDRVADMEQTPCREFMALPALLEDQHHANPAFVLDEYFTDFRKDIPNVIAASDQAVHLIFERHGMIGVKDIAQSVGVGERQLEQLFKRFVGVPPKLFCRIIRFNYIFQLVQQPRTWSDVAYQAAFYDQSHFIRNFRDFTGENPADYSFDEKNLANFFLNKKNE